ncbi:hypothetical protein [Hymenobacter psychrophilus]|uniref:Lipoprotein n=1 Tax=Hymenobacter psychrophilus TaxID=651662 RepID=A0A1H3BHK6_9BACT|nr:hypothetical protein [Hymenobacter psychrophilus]SDX40844.1 hypothetical protein SAMN04488069_101278 [Hymenobacter psychrophilus]
MSRLFPAASAFFASPAACAMGACGKGKPVGSGPLMVKKSKKRTPTRPSH